MKFALFTSTLIVLLTIGSGVYLFIKPKRISLRKILGTNIALFIPVVIGLIYFMIPEVGYALETNADNNLGIGLIAAAQSTGLATIGTGIAVGSVGSSALGAVSEDPKILGKTLIFVGLAEGIAIYGLIVSILILGRI
jgi:V/A-type H+-transporting ATPase subunit K